MLKRTQFNCQQSDTQLITTVILACAFKQKCGLAVSKCISSYCWQSSRKAAIIFHTGNLNAPTVVARAMVWGW